MKSYICDICEIAIKEPYSAKMREFCFTFSNSDFDQVAEKTKRKVKIHLCNNCYERFKNIVKEKTQKGGAK